MTEPYNRFEHRYGFARNDVTLGNWRTRPYSSWSFQNVSELVPSAEISTSATTEAKRLRTCVACSLSRSRWATVVRRLAEFLERSNTDALAVMKSGTFVGDYASPTADPTDPASYLLDQQVADSHSRWRPAG